mmetsp:Transcript_1076/g.2347  ORF Transcript_1076/g.2347 Transcript_1076/m.2347 type:complete len:208 (-) Transcript_1076:251-874(-)
MSSLSLHRGEVLIIDDPGQLLCGFVVLADGAEVGDVDLNVVRLQHQVSSKGAEGSLLWHQALLDEFHKELPDAGVLRDWQRSQRRIKGPSCVGDLLLLHKELHVVEPDSGHLVEEDQCSFVGIVCELVLAVRDAKLLAERFPLLEVGSPKLVGTRKLLHRSIVDQEADSVASVCLRFQVGHPDSYIVRILLEFLFVGNVCLLQRLLG